MERYSLQYSNNFIEQAYSKLFGGLNSLFSRNYRTKSVHDLKENESEIKHLPFLLSLFGIETLVKIKCFYEPKDKKTAFIEDARGCQDSRLEINVSEYKGFLPINPCKIKALLEIRRGKELPVLIKYDLQR